MIHESTAILQYLNCNPSQASNVYSRCRACISSDSELYPIYVSHPRLPMLRLLIYLRQKGKGGKKTASWAVVINKLLMPIDRRNISASMSSASKKPNLIIKSNNHKFLMTLINTDTVYRGLHKASQSLSLDSYRPIL